MFRSYVWGLGLTGSLGREGDAGALLLESSYDINGTSNYFPSFDGIGNTVALVSAADGHPRAQYEYGPFGEIIRESDAVVGSNSIMWNGKYMDHETNMSYYGCRYLKDGRWINRDVINENGGVNLYEFANNNPIVNYDSLGQFGVDVSTAAKYPKFAALIQNARASLTYAGFQSIRRWGMVCPVNLTKSRNAINDVYTYGGGPVVSAVRPGTKLDDGDIMDPEDQARFAGPHSIVFSDFWIAAYEKGFVADGDAKINALLGHEVVHFMEFIYSHNNKALAKFTGYGSDGTLDKKTDNHPAANFEWDTYGKRAILSLSIPYNQIKDQLPPLR